MIEITRLGNQPLVVNADLIEFIEQTPDTMISTTSGKKILVQETVNEVIAKVIEYRRLCNAKKTLPAKKSSKNSKK